MLTVIALDYHVTRRRISRVQARTCQYFLNPVIRQFFPVPEKSGERRNKKWNHDEVHEAVKMISLFQISGTIRDLACALGMPKSMLFNMKYNKDDLVIIACTSAIKPVLTE
jgi:hypothetical protein